MIVKCKADIPEAKYHNDILHPCVRFNPQGFLGHKWWMIVSPWYNRNDKIENPILFWGDDEADGTPPTKWNFFAVVKDTPETGYNSDPNIEFIENGIKIIWREVETPLAKKHLCYSLLVSKTIDNHGNESEETVITRETSKTNLTDLSPIVLWEHTNEVLYTAFHKKSKNIVKRILCKFLRSIGIIRYASQTSYLLLRSKSDDFRSFKKQRIYISKRFLPWHFDVIEYHKRKFILLYCEYENNIFIGEIQNDKIIIDETPITSNLRIHDTYKPTGCIIENTLWLYYTDKLDGKTGHNELFRVPIQLNDLTTILK